MIKIKEYSQKAEGAENIGLPKSGPKHKWKKVAEGELHMTLDQHDGPLTDKRKLLDGPIAIELNRVSKRQAFKHVHDIA